MASNTSQWIYHVNYIIKKPNKRLCYLVLLKRAKVPSDDILKFYCTCMRPIIEYGAPVFHNSLPGHLSNEIERIEKRALSCIFIVYNKISITPMRPISVYTTTHVCNITAVRLYLHILNTISPLKNVTKYCS